MQSNALLQFVLQVGMSVIIFLGSWDDRLFGNIYTSLVPCVFPKYASSALRWDALVYWENKTFSTKCL